MVEKISQSRGLQLLLIVTLILVVPLMVDINRRISVIRRMRQEQTRLEQEISTAWEDNAALKAEQAYVEMPAFLDRWARVDARMTLPGEVAIVPMSPRSASEMPTAPRQTGAGLTTARSISDEWHQLFFDLRASQP
jgi:cell division protein FtsB